MNTAAKAGTDPYGLQPGELTKEMFAEKAGISTKTVENFINAGKIVGEYQRRSVDGKPVRPKLIIMESELEKVNQSIKTTELMRAEDTSEKVNLFVAEKLGRFADAIDNFSGNAGQNLLTGASSNGHRSTFLTIVEASNEYGLGQKEIHRLIESNDLRAFRGKNGEILVSRKQIENL